MKLKANTVEQLHILRFLQEKFYIDTLKIELLDRNKVKITDFTGESAEFAYNKTSGKVEMLPQKDEKQQEQEPPEEKITHKLRKGRAR